LQQIGKRRWRLLESVEAKAPDVPAITAPVGFETDGASVPRIFWNVCPPMSNYTNAAVIHDFLYDNKGQAQGVKYTRAQADKVFLDAMTALGVARWRRRVMYRAVRMFGPRW
jgi:hypothetical protein